MYETDIALFQKEAEHWNITSLLSESKVSEINIPALKIQELILGGPKAVKPPHLDTNDIYPLFERIYKGLLPHQHVTVIGKFWCFGDFHEEGLSLLFTMEVDSMLSSFPGEIVRPSNPNKITFPENETNFRFIRFSSSHTPPDLVISIFFRTNRPEKITIGFRELTIHLSNDSRTYQDYICHTSGKKDFGAIIQCKCPFHQGMDKDSVCQDCSPNCASCIGAEPSQCSLCSAGAHWNGFECSTCHWGCKQCTGSSQHECSACNIGYYNYGNGSCIKTCKWPFQAVENGLEKQCVKPCKPNQYVLKPGQFLLKPENKCVDECPMPFSKFLREDILTCEDPCERLRFLYWNGSCISSCPLPLVTAMRFDSQLCTNPCEGASPYLYSSQTCLPDCPAPLQIRSEPGVSYCLNPCQPTNHYLYNNGSCHPSCRSPLRIRVENGIKYCLNPCDSATEYILGNGSCSLECPGPLVKKLEPGVGTHCLSPCESDDHFVANNGSCLQNCPSFFDVEIKYGVKYCLNPCSSNQSYFEQNKSCLQTCPYPLKIKSKAGANFCQNPCSGSNDFLYDDQSCHKNCPGPLVSLTEPAAGAIGKYCKNPCDGENKYLGLDGSCRETCDYPYKILSQGPYQMCLIDRTPSEIHQLRSIGQIVKASSRISEIGGLFSSFVNAGDPTSLFMIPLLRMLEMIKYTEIIFPVFLDLSLNRDRLEGNTEHRRLLKRLKMEDEEIFRDLEETFDDSILEIGIVGLIAFLLRAVLKYTRPIFSESKPFRFFERFSFALQWNILAPLFICKLGDIILFSLVTLSQDGFRFKSYQLSLSLFVVMPSTILLLYKIITISSEVRKIREEENLLHFQRWRFLFETYRFDRVYQRLFVGLFVLRMALMSIIIGCLYEYPRIQAVLLVLISFGTLFYLIVVSPIEKRTNFIQHIVIESVMLLYNILLAILAVEKDSQNIDADMKNALGHLMTILRLLTSITTTGMILAKLSGQIYYLYCKTWSPRIAPSSRGFIQLNEVSHNEEINEESTEPSHLSIVDENENNLGKPF